MNTQNQRRKPEEIETDIYQSRARLDDTLHELEARLSPQNLVNNAFDYVRQGGANDIMASVGKTVKRNPLPVMLTGIGVGWFMFSQRNAKRQETYTTNLPVRQTDTTTVPATLNDAAPTQTTAKPSTPQPRSVGASATGPGTTGAGTTSTGKDPASVGASATPSPASPQVSDYSSHNEQSHSEQGRMSGGKEKARHMTDQVKGRAQHMTGTLRDRATQARTGSRSAMHNLGTRAQGAGTQTTNFIQEHPLVAGAIGVAIGAALGSLFPTSRIENERMGSVRDRAMHKAQETGQQQVEKAQQRVHEEADKAQQRVHEKAEEAKKSGSSSSSESDNRQTTSGAGSSSTSATSTSDKTGGTSGTTGTTGSHTAGGNDHTPTRGG